MKCKVCELDSDTFPGVASELVLECSCGETMLFSSVVFEKYIGDGENEYGEFGHHIKFLYPIYCHKCHKEVLGFHKICIPNRIASERWELRTKTDSYRRIDEKHD